VAAAWSKRTAAIKVSVAGSAWTWCNLFAMAAPIEKLTFIDYC
jgi:hypothetical protein